jgi:hypothetical protein
MRLLHDNMNRALLTTVAAFVIAIVAVAATVMLVHSGGNDPNIGSNDGGGYQLSFPGNLSDDEFSIYLGQKGSSDMTLLDAGGKFTIPASDAMIMVVAKNPTADVSVDGNDVLIPENDGTLKVTVAFDNAKTDDPVVMDHDSAYYAFVPNVENVNLGLFTTND